MTDDLREIFKNTKDLDKKSMSFLISAIKKNNKPGFDYIEFKQALMKLSSMHNEVTANKSVFATASTMGIDKEHIITSAEYYRDLLHREKSEFDKALESQINQRISVKKAQSEKLQSKIQELEIKVKECNEKIAEFNQLVTKTNKEIQQAEVKITDTKEKFELTYQRILSEISADIEFLKEKI